jgi:hypothetical protein
VIASRRCPMASTDAASLPIVEPEAPACRHLRSSGMYLYSDRPDGGTHDEYDNTVFWCTKSLKEFGPDDEIAGRLECRDPSRSCYEPI